MRRLDGNDTPRENLSLIHGQLPGKGANHGRQQTSHLGLGKTLTDAAPGAVQKGQELIVALSAAVGVGLTRLRVDPALRAELAGLGAPDLGGPVHLPHGEDEGDALGDELLAADVGVAHGLAHGDGDSRVEAQRLVHDAVEVGEGLEEGAQVCRLAVGVYFLALEGLAHFIAQLLLQVLVLR